MHTPARSVSLSLTRTYCIKKGQVTQQRSRPYPLYSDSQVPVESTDGLVKELLLSRLVRAFSTLYLLPAASAETDRWLGGTGLP